MSKPLNVIQQTELTNYAFALMTDLEKVMRLGKLFAPVVPSGTSTGLYNVFSDLNSFRTYAETRRAVGGKANAIQFLSTTGTFNAQPYGLRIPLDNHERAQAGDQIELLKRAKTRTLMVGCANSYTAQVIAAAKAAVAAQSGKGEWSNANKDPILELDEQIEAIWLASGMLPNVLAIDFGAWLKLKNHPKVHARMPGADLAVVSPERLGAMLAAPGMRIEIVTSAMYANRTDEAANTKKGALAGTAMLFFSSEMPDQYDASFMKTFSPSADLFTGIISYEEAPHVEWFENDWTSDVKVVSATMARRIDVT